MQRYTNPAYHSHFEKFREGNEKGLEFFYNLLYSKAYHHGLRYIKDDVNADCIVNEAFLRLWLSRKIIRSPEHVEEFVRKLISNGCKAYFKSSNNKFNRNMLRLDQIENYQEFLADNGLEYDDEPGIFYTRECSDTEKMQWKRVEAILPNLSHDQQLFIKLCIRYSFDYGKIALHVGGISDYQVAVKVEKVLACLRAIIADTEKLNSVKKNSRFSFEGDVSDQEATILKMRYELQYSFAEIAEALCLDQGNIQKVFAAASLKIRKVKIS